MYIKLLVEMKCLSFSFTSLKSLYPIFAGIAFGLRTYNFYEPSFLFKSFLMEIGMMLAIFLELITICRQGRKRKSAPVQKEFASAWDKYKSQPKIVLLIILGFWMDLIGFI